MYKFGETHDQKVRAHTKQMLNITPDTGMFLSILVQAIKARNVLEIGTSSGYSAIWMANALSEIRGRITTIEVSLRKASLAKENFRKSKLSDLIDFHLEDARQFLKRQDSETYDMIFLDAERPEYASYWTDVDRVLKSGGLLIVDNALSPKPEELIEFFKLVEQSGRYLFQTLQLGKGEMVALKQSTRRQGKFGK